MATKIRITGEVFLDTAYAIALSVVSDLFHGRAVEIAEQLEAGGAKLITTRAVLIEIGNALSKVRYRPAAIALLDSLEEDASVEIVPISDDLYASGLELYRKRPDKEWGLTDCISCVVMQDRRIKAALTADDHFAQMGFRVLLRES